MINFDEIKRQAVGRWPGLYQSLGIEVGDGRHCPCPICSGKDRFRFDDKDGTGSWFCSQCEPHAGDGWALIQKILECDFKSACEQVAGIIGGIKPTKSIPVKSISRDALNKMFRESKPITKDCLAGQYLKGRGLNIFPDTLRYTSACWESETKQNQCAMLAVQTRVDGQAINFHRTYLDLVTMDKLNINGPRKYTPVPEKWLKKNNKGKDKGPVTVIRLFPSDHGQIGIAEGIETAIACTQKFGVPTWAARDAGFLEKFELPTGIKQVHIFGDNDPNYTGQAAAYKLANKLVVQKKIDAIVHIPDRVGDWLDFLNT